ncbi:hypothetical protein POM88_036075 [Heracleum sosnowskyi]|uniref:Aminotransferase-like plant mobile domain-containing protein n=1 Tax=Heracleum sosnowskyi TaxID=360622 RepID=A0AAD8HNJ6_9APIA|nr:hypothetical protein POM88_036075 [Heracleum sosnowskyi]
MNEDASMHWKSIKPWVGSGTLFLDRGKRNNIKEETGVSDDAYSDDIELQPGPRDPTVLYLQAEHRSTNVWNVGGGDSQRSRVRCKFPALHPRMVPILRNLRFDGVARLADGNVITGSTRVEGAEGGWNDDELVRYTQAYLLQLLGGVLFTDHQDSQVHWCVLLVQLWAWTRLPTLAPVPSPPPLDIWGDHKGPYGLRWSGPKSFADVSSHVISIFDRISAIARGDVVGGSNNLIDSIANHGRRVLEYQYSRGLFQDFPVDVRRTREETLRGKTKKVGHKGGRGGINAPKRRKLDIDNEAGDHVHEDVHLGDEDHLVEGGGQDFADFVASGTSTHDLDEVPNVDLSAPCPHPTFDCIDSELPPPQQHRATTIVRPSPSSYVPSFRLLASNDFLTPHEQPPVEDNVEEHPELLTHCDTTIQLSQSASVPTFRLLASNDFLTPPSNMTSNHRKNLDGNKHQRKSLYKQKPPAEGIIEEQPVVEQLQTPIEEQEEVAHEAHPMKLRTRNRHPPKCGTDAGDHVHEDVHLGDEDHLVKGGGQDFADFVVGGTSTHDLDEVPNVDLSALCPHPTFDCIDSEFPPPQQHRATTIVRPSPSSYVPNFRLLASNDFLTPHEQPPVEDNVEEHPELQTHRDTTIQLSQSAYVPTFRLLASNDFLTPPLVEQHDQQSSEEPRRQQAPAEEFVQEKPPAEGIIEEQPVVEQLQTPIEEQEEVAHEAHPMKLRTRNRHPPKCGTDGIKKAPEVKQHYERIRKKHA